MTTTANPQALALAAWVRSAMRFIDRCDADAAGFDELHDVAEKLTEAGYMLFGMDPERDDACLAALENKPLIGL